jgi:hypothetical protein
MRGFDQTGLSSKRLQNSPPHLNGKLATCPVMQFPAFRPYFGRALPEKQPSPFDEIIACLAF